MPIKDQSIYPPYWKQFSLYIRKERAEDKCEQCGVENYAVGARGKDGVFRDERSISGLNSDVGMALYGTDFNWKMTKIVLTVAHLDNTGGICDCKRRTGRKCAIPDHVLALCQKCHLQMDLPHHLANRRKSAEIQKDAERHLFEELA